MVGLFLLLLVAWNADTALQGDDVARNVTVGGQDVGGLSDEELEVEVQAVADDFATAEVVITTPKGEIESDSASLGLQVDVPSTVEAAKDEGNDGFFLVRPFAWIGSFFVDRPAPMAFEVEARTLRTALADEPAAENQPVKEPALVVVDGEVGVEPGENGEAVDIEGLLDALPAAASSGERPIRVEVGWAESQPTITDAQIEALVDETQELSDASFDAIARDQGLSVPGSIFGSAWRSELVGGSEVSRSVRLALDPELALAAIEDHVSSVTSVSSARARFTVEGGVPRIVLPEQTEVCCDPAVVELLLPALRGDEEEPVDLPLRDSDPEAAREALESLGIVEQVASYTTNHSCCENRVDNIHQISDIVRGAVIRPGATFSINDYVGQRTTEKGFVPAPTIVRGVLEDNIGGGISQFATTIFNTAFFAGLDFGEYQSHSLYISRYPYGREATVSWTAPDLQIRNNTDYGVLIWPTYTNSSITVTFYSTEHIDVEQTGQTESEQGVCTRVTTERRRTYADGSTADDTVFAVYRPGEGINCDGSRTVPTTEAPVPDTTSPSTSAPAPTTSQAAPPPTTAAVTTTSPTPPTTSGGGPTTAPIPPTSTP